MFRIESYITPIILSHIDKYVKDFRPKDAQVSLWGGEVAFQNLDLRLDVLEDELQLPFSFVSGHIHELTVRVPWTKIASEPIQITINTIEFVLKLRQPDDIDDRGHQNRSRQSTTSGARRKSRNDAPADVAPSGYMATLVNKIANNISVKLNNVILKYVEDDIVVSMNIQLLSFSSANDLWQPDFVDISPTKVLLKKVINITDLTVCLDKRNAMGIIDICQEPLLYRCSLQIRLLRRYNIASAHRTSLLRMDIHTDSIELNISAQQYPMLLRLFELAETLRDGRMRHDVRTSAAASSTAAAGIANTTAENVDATAIESAGATNNENSDRDNNPDDAATMLGWAWSLLPNLFPADDDNDEHESADAHAARTLGHVLHTGCYVNRLTVTIKSQQLVGNNISNAAKKLKYDPLLRAQLVGMYVSCVTVGRRWFNATGGIAYVAVQPLGICMCGVAHGSAPVLSSAAILSTHRGHLDGSLWDTDCPEYRDEVRSYDRIWESHATRNPMDELQRRTPAVAFDVTHDVDVDDEPATRGSGQHSSASSMASNLEYSNLAESYVCRAVVGEIVFRYTAGVRHIGQQLAAYARQYNYQPYVMAVPLVTRDSLAAPAADDYDALMSGVPVRLVEIHVQRPVLELHVVGHEALSGSLSLSSLSSSALPPPPSAQIVPAPFVVVELEDVCLRMRSPMYPNRLVHTTCMLAEAPARLLDECYTQWALDFRSATGRLAYGGNVGNHPIWRFSSAELTYRELLYPHLWQSKTAAKRRICVNAESVQLLMNCPQLMVMQSLADAFGSENNDAFATASNGTSMLVDANDASLVVIDLCVQRPMCTYSVYDRTFGLLASVNSIRGLAYNPATIERIGFIESHKHQAIILAAEPAVPNEYLTVKIQMSDDMLGAPLNTGPIPWLVVVSMESVALNVDPLLLDFVGYRVRHGDEFVTYTMDCKTCKSTNTLTSQRSASSSDRLPPVTDVADPLAEQDSATKSSLMQIFPSVQQRPSAVAPPGAKTSYVSGNTAAVSLLPLYELAAQTVIHVELKSSSVYVPRHSLRMPQRDSKLSDCLRTAGNAIDVTSWQLPSVQWRSAHDPAWLSRVQASRLCPLINGATDGGAKPTKRTDGFPWNVTLSGMEGSTRIGGQELRFMRTDRTNVTVAVSVAKSTTRPTPEPSFVIHSDSGPLELRLSDPQVVFLLYAVDGLQVLCAATQRLFSAGKTTNGSVDVAESVPPLSPGRRRASGLNEFFGTAHESTISDGATTLTTLPDPKQPPTTTTTAAGIRHRSSIWLQWTLAKITVTVYAADSQRPVPELRFRLDMEDLIASYDQQDDYTKWRLKAGTLNGTCHQKRATDASTTANTASWERLKGLGVTARNTHSETLAEETFAELTITQALTKNVHGRWFSMLRKKQKQQLINTIGEVMVTLQSIDVTIDVALLEAFVPVVVALAGGAPESTEPIRSEDQPKPQHVWSVRDFPIAYLKSEGVRVFLPVPQTSSTSPICDVFIFKVSRILVNPATENPLYRKPIRADIYTKAAELNILNVPGSSVENRQYEITFGSMSLSSGRWEQILDIVEPSVSSVKNAHKKNPAFDWNNLTVRPSVEIRTIFERFNVSVIYAPCIVFENVLVCGECLEVNCVTDLIVDLQSHEVRLLMELAAGMNDVMAKMHPKADHVGDSLISRSSKTSTTTTMAKIPSHSDQSKTLPTLTDSGVESMVPQQMRTLPTVRRPNSRHSKQNHTFANTNGGSTIADNMLHQPQGIAPYDMSFVGGIFNVKVYSRRATEYIPPESNVNHTPAATNPLFSFTVFQPNVLVSQSVRQRTTQLSVFNLIVRLGASTSGTDDANGNINGNGDFSDTLFSTLPGKPTQSGIPQPLLRLRKQMVESNVDVDIQVNRANVLNISHQKCQQVMAIMQMFTADTQIQHTDSNRPVPTHSLFGYKYKSIRATLFDADRIRVSLDATTIDCRWTPPTNDTVAAAFASYAATFGWSQVGATIGLCNRQQSVRLDATVHAIALHSDRANVLNPTTLSVSATLVKRPWKRQPICLLSLRAPCVDVCIGANSLLNLMRISDSMRSILGPANDTDRVVVPSNDAHLPIDVELLPISTPKVSGMAHAKSDDSECNEVATEYYQDDLRAGAFQFVESMDTSAADKLPLPYQIRISSQGVGQSGGSICWRYRQPRSLHFVQVFPVIVEQHWHRKRRGNDSVRCELQYYADVIGEFRPFIEFELSETDIQKPSLPRQPIIAETWRIIVHQNGGDSNDGCSDSDEPNDDDDIDDNSTDSTPRPHLHPRVLVGCLRIDSKFHPRLAPSCELAFRFDHFNVAVRHDRESTTTTNADTTLPTLPAPLRQFRLADTFDRDLQTLVRLNQRQISVCSALYDDLSWTASGQTRVGLDVLDVGSLTMQPLLDECLVRCSASSNGLAPSSTTKSPIIYNVVVDLVRLRYGQCIGYTLTLAQQLWHNAFRAHASSAVPRLPATASVIIPHRYMLCNSTTATLRFGQTGTDEQLYVRPNECLPYAFRSVCGDQLLRVSSESAFWTFAEPFGTEQIVERTQTVYAAAGSEDRRGGQLLSMQTQRMSHSDDDGSGNGASQLMIRVRGQVECRNMTEQSFQLLYRSTVGDADTVAAADVMLAPKSCVSLVTRCDDEVQQTIKIRFANGNKHAWSGKIPLGPKSLSPVPMLVKVPTNNEHKFNSFWVRIVRENLTLTTQPVVAEQLQQPQRLLVLIWPIFMVRSLLPIDVTVYLDTTKTACTLAGRGQQSVEFQTPGTTETHHELTFDTDSFFLTTVKLCYETTDRALFQAAVETLSIDDIHQQLDSLPALRWPCGAREEETRWLRRVTPSLEPMQLAFNRLASQPQSSCLMLDVVPACMIINSVGSTMHLLTATGTSTMVHANEMATMGTLTTPFTLSFRLNNHLLTTCPIYNTDHHTRTRAARSKPSYELADTGSTVVKMLGPHALCKYHLSSSLANGSRVLIVSPHFVVVNHTAHTFDAWAFCVLQRHRADLKLPVQSEPIGSFVVPPSRSDAEPSSHRGAGINAFYNLSHDPSDTNFNKLYNYFVAVRIGGTDNTDNVFSMPIPLNRAVPRKCFSIDSHDATTGQPTSIPLAVSIIEHDGQTYVSLHADTSPCIRLVNRTDRRLYVAQSQTPVDGAMATVAAQPSEPLELQLSGDDQFEWYSAVDAGRTCFYTPVGWDADFPDNSTDCSSLGLMVAACQTTGAFECSAISSDWGWCRPFAVFRPHETVLDLPLVGDVRVQVDCVRRRTVTVCVSQLDHCTEFNVKDIRTKLQQPPVRSGGERDGDAAGGTLTPSKASSPIASPKRAHNCPTASSPLSPTTAVAVNLFVDGVHLTFFTDNEQRGCRKTELIAIYFDQIAASYDAGDGSGDLRLADMQIDNQLHASGSYDFPVLLCMQPIATTTSTVDVSASATTTSTTSPSSSTSSNVNYRRRAGLPSPLELDTFGDTLFATMRPALAVHVQLCADDADGHRMAAVDKLSVDVRPISAYIEDRFVNVLLAYVLDNLAASQNAIETSAGTDTVDNTPQTNRVRCAAGQVLVPRAVLTESAELAQPLRIGSIRIEPLAVLLSVHTCQRMYIALDHTPLAFGAYERHNVCSVRSRVAYALGRHYVSGALLGAGWVVGSLEILGSPGGLARSCATGLRDFVSKPVEGVMARGPWGLLVGITHGSASLVRNVTAGTVNSVTKLAASVARNLDRLTLDAEHLARTEAQRQRQRPGSISEGIALGLTGLGISMLGAVGGLSRHPLEAQSSMAVVTGFGRGLVGAVTKPISGAAELVALTGQSVLQTVGFNVMPTARRAATKCDRLLEPAAAKIMSKYVPSANGDGSVLFVTIGWVPRKDGCRPTCRHRRRCRAGGNSGAVCLALCSHLLVVIDMESDQVLQLFALERIVVRLNEADNTLVHIIRNVSVDTQAEEQEFQYSRVLQYVNESSGLVFRPPESDKIASDKQEQPFPQPVDLLDDDAKPTNETAYAVEPMSMTTKTVISMAPSSLNRNNVTDAGSDQNLAVCMMDEHWARYLVQYVQLLQRTVRMSVKS